MTFAQQATELQCGGSAIHYRPTGKGENLMEKTIEEILNEAIRGEEESYHLYTSAVGLVDAQHVKETLQQLAGEELGHKANLEKMLASPGQVQRSVRKLQQAPIQDYKIGDHLVVEPLSPESTFQDVCIFASRKEQQSYELYRDLAEQYEGEIHDLFEAMARDELRHKNLVEGWYEEVIYQDF
jgi:rubrerythrin